MQRLLLVGTGKYVFQENRGFPGVIGAIDATHDQIQPPHDHPQSYVNRKSYHSIFLQAVCIHDTSFSHCFSGWPGSAHDSRGFEKFCLMG